MNIFSRAWAAFQRTVGPRHFYEISGTWLPWLLLVAVIFTSVGLVWGLLFAPPDYQQGNSFRIIYIHVPSASVAMSAYLMLAICAVISLVWRVKTAEMAAQAAAPVGAIFCFLALVTGGIWGKPTWGTYWVWDARLTSMLILLFLYIGVIAIQNAFEYSAQAAKAAAILALVGVVNLPIIKYSVEWWNTLHQGATFKLTEKPSMPPEMWMPLLVSIIGLYAFFTWLVIWRTRHHILHRESRQRWVRELVMQSSRQGEC
jgi:heme exporter protein C